LTKTGTGTLTLGGNSTFNGGVVVQQGTLLIGTGTTTTGGSITSGPLGTGPLSLAANTTFGSATAALTLANDVSIADGVTLVTGSNTGSYDDWTWRDDSRLKQTTRMCMSQEKAR